MIENDWKFRIDSTDLRDFICEYFEQQYEKVRFLEEKNIGKVRADMIAVLPQGFVGIEIKSHCDTYARLKTQIKDYDKFCDFNYLFVGSRHLHAEEHVPKYWGIVIINVRNGVDFEVLRPPQQNPKCKIEKQLGLLWHDELSYILKENKLPRYPGKSRAFICERLCKKLPQETLKLQLCDRLFERDYAKYL